MKEFIKGILVLVIGFYMITSSIALTFMFNEPKTKCIEYSKWKVDKEKSFSLHVEKNRNCLVYKVLTEKSK